jgi:hypothetical protein
MEKRMNEKSIKKLIYEWLEDFSKYVPENFLDIFLKAKEENLIFQKSIWLNNEELIKQNVKKEMDDIKPFIEGKVFKKELSEEECKVVKNRRLSLLFLMSYREDEEFFNYSNLLEELTAIEESFILWRTR